MVRHRDMINEERYRKIDEIFQAALELDPDERSSYISQACSGDESLRKEIDSLLSSDGQEWALIKSPAFEIAAPLLARDQLDLVAGELLSHYKILTLLGVGGMGQVYLAEDTRLRRKVALKLLPTSSTRSESQLRRFQQEARAASALNHPNIVTIHDIWEIEGRHIIATEYIEGESLRQRIRKEKLGTDELLDISIQVASALRAAHQAGIIHRDIKPENIMLRSDGLVKVLDFGLAKLMDSPVPVAGVTEAIKEQTDEPSSAGMSNAEGGSRVNTASGLLMGTLPYMSPEQVKGQELDVRTDIFSLGVVIYEMVSGSTPFDGETNAKLIRSILEKNPEPLSQVSARETSQLRPIVERTLCKERNERYQTSGELLEDLKVVKQDIGLKRSSPPQKSWFKRHKLATLATLLIGTVGIIFVLSTARHRSTAPLQNPTMTRLTTYGSAVSPAISPDGKYVVYGRDEGKKMSLWLKEVGTTNEIQIAPSADGEFHAAVFSPDSRYIYYSVFIPQSPTSLYQVLVPGGTPTKVPIEEVYSLSFSPDGKRFAYVYNNLKLGQTVVMTANSDGTDQQEIVKRQAPDYFPNHVISWSPDGRLIACVGRSTGNDGYPRIVVVNLEEKTEEPITSQRWNSIWGIAWLPDMSGLVLAATEESSSVTRIWHISYPGGEARRITSDVNSYQWTSLTADGSALVTLQIENPSRIWVIPVEENTSTTRINDKLSVDTTSGRQISTSKFDGYPGVCWTPDGRIVYASAESGNRDIWIMDADGSNRKQLTTDSHLDFWPSVSPDGRYIVFVSNRAGADHIWRMDIDGRNEKELTTGGVERYPICSPDSKWVVYNSWLTGIGTISKVPIEGGKPTQITESPSFFPAVSRDGQLIVYNFQGKISIISIEGGAPIKTFDAPPDAKGQLRWTPDGHALMYLSSKGKVVNIGLLPLDGGEPRPLTDFQSDGVLFYDLSPDGKQVACSRGTQTRDVVLISNFR